MKKTKKMIALILAITLTILFDSSILGASAEIATKETTNKFVVDGILDYWYVSEGDEVAEGHENLYHMTHFDAFYSSDGKSHYDEPVTEAQAWTAWDDDYVYIYVKVWDSEIEPYDKNNTPTGQTAVNVADGIGLFFDPDPNSQAHTYLYDENGNIYQEVPKDFSDIKGGFYNQTSDSKQGDIQFFWIAGNDEITDYHNIVKPGYGGISFGDYIKDPSNLATFTFDNDPIYIESTKKTISSGYGLEVRLPQNDDFSNFYRFHIYATNSASTVSKQYTLATGELWHLRFDNAWHMLYEGNPPFFEKFYDSTVIDKAAAQTVIDLIAALPATIDLSHKSLVVAARSAYNDLTETQKSYVTNLHKLVNAESTIVKLEEDAANKAAAKTVIDLINALPTPITLDHKSMVYATRLAYESLTETQKSLVNNLHKLTAAEYIITYLEKEAADKAAAQVVIDMIVATKNAYNDLSNDQKALVDNYMANEGIGERPSSPTGITYGDVDGDGKITANDALNILKKVVGKIDRFPVEG